MLKYVKVSAGLVVANPMMTARASTWCVRPRLRRRRGRAWWTPNIDWAQKFDSVGELAAEWRRASTVVPTRPDGKPNRPPGQGCSEPVEPS